MPSHDLAGICRQIAERRLGADSLVVAVDGPSGSGKTRLARRVARALGDSTLVRMDHVVPGWDGLEESTRLIRPVLEQLRAGEPVRYRVWDWSIDGWGAPLSRPPAAHVVLEGCGAGALHLADLVDFLIYVDAPPEVRRKRAIARDGASYEAHWARWAAQEEAHYSANRTRQRADLVIDGRVPVR